MIERNRIKPLIGVLCIVLVLLAAVVAVILDSRSPDPILGIFHNDPEPTETTADPTGSAEATTPAGGATTPTAGAKDPEKDKNETTQGANKPTTPADEQVTPPTDLPSSVVIPTEKDPVTGETGISFPCQIPEYGLTIEKMAPYDGMYVEDGTNVSTQNVAMLMVTNNGDFPVEYTQIRVMCGQEELLFDITALPVGQKLVVQEKTGKPMNEAVASAATALVVQRANMEMSEGKVKVTDNGDNTLTIQNLTNETIPTVRVFYKYYMENEELFVGGIAFTVRISKLGAGASMTIQPSHYTSQSSRVVMVLTYDSEV